ncbi:RNA 2',3'-cyclic phosphodiesterase [Candidatus Parcubacteria bacterium]|nr:RNA 2',3'-cyclic phosphodiesterase [Candidatus Parcubacteria bacterium]
MLHRLFFAINIPDDIRLELVKYQKQWRRYPARWTKPENLHFTALFLGNVDDEQLIILRQKAGGMLNSFRSFTVKLTEIALGPPQGLANMVWAMAVADPEPAAADLSAALSQIARAAKIDFPNDTRPLQLHLTLGRAKGPHLKGVPIAATLKAAFAAGRVDLMESTLHEDGPRYRVVASYKLF